MNLEDDQHSLLTFRVGPVLCCAPSLPVSSIITPPKLTQPPGSDQAQPGIFRHGSHIVKVIDLRQKFGVDINEQTQPGNLIITRFNNESYAFWVDQILDVIDFPKEGWGNLPAAIPRGVFSRTLLLIKKIHLYSEFEKLVTINDLGYLKHYIQQLKDDVNKKTSSEVKGINSSLSGKTTVKKNGLNKNSATIDKQEETTKQNLTATTEPSTTTAAYLQKPVKKTFTAAASDDERPSLSAASRPTSTKSKAGSDFINRSERKQTQTSDITARASAIKNDITKTTNTRTTPHKPQKNNTVVKATITDRKQDDSISSSSLYLNKNKEDKNKFNKVSTSISAPGKNASSKKTSTQHSAKVYSSQPDNEGQTSSTGLVLFILILLCALVIGGFFLFSNENTKSSKQKSVSQTKNIEPEFTLYEPSSEILKEPIIIESNSTEAKTSENINTESTQVKSVTGKVEQAAPSAPDLNLNDENKDSSYRAEITQQESEITITLHRPNTAEVKPATAPQETGATLELPLAEAQEIKPSVIDETVSNQPDVQTLKQNEIAKPLAEKKAIKEIIHIVAKGDTLWAIAKKYVNDPFLYPELARLSNIKNPHRIYPGNRVRIRFINN